MSTAVMQEPHEAPAPPEPQQTRQRRPSQTLRSDYVLDIPQQPRQARMAGSGEKADRRPIDPPPIIRLRIRKPHARTKPGVALTDADLLTPTLTHTLFMFASLVPENSEEEMYDIAGSKSKLVAGSVVSSLFHLKDQSCFVFPDLSIRVEGRWRFKMSLFELAEDGVHFCTAAFTDVFQVYSSKRFPGMGKSTELSKSFAQQGLKLRIRRPGSKAADDDDEPAPRRKTASSQRASTSEAFATPAASSSRRPSAPVTSTSAIHPAQKRPWTSYDSAAGPSQSGHPHAHPHAYSPYPPRTASNSRHFPAPPPPVDGRRVVPYGHPHAHETAQPYPSVAVRHHLSPPSSSTAAFPPSASAYPPHLPPGYRTAPYAHASGPTLAPLGAPQMPHSRSHHTLSPPQGAGPLLSHSHSHPAHLAAARPHPHAHLPPPHPHQLATRSPSPPPILAPIRSFPSVPPPRRDPASLSATSTPVSAVDTPAASSTEQGYDAAAVLASLGATGAGRARRATESSVRSTGSEEGDEAGVSGKGGGEGDVEMHGDKDAGQEPAQPQAARGSLAMLLGGGGPGGESGAGKGTEGVSFF
ncbi:hypothetical protein JCM10207_007181 [Rhodosporidiobolus poonsookiae]